jgi:porin
MLETGLTAELELANEALPGTYRVGLWNDPQPKANSNASRNHRDDVGFYLSCDQMLTKENAEPEDSQGLAVFVRCGYASGRKNDIAGFWSVGFQYQGIVEGRDEDVLGAGLAQSIFSDSASGTYTEDHESAIELYYNIHMAPWASVSPSMQYIADPGGNETVDDAVVVGVRAQVVF